LVTVADSIQYHSHSELVRNNILVLRTDRTHRSEWREKWQAHGFFSCDGAAKGGERLDEGQKVAV